MAKEIGSFTSRSGTICDEGELHLERNRRLQKSATAGRSKTRQIRRIGGPRNGSPDGACRYLPLRGSIRFGLAVPLPAKRARSPQLRVFHVNVDDRSEEESHDLRENQTADD